MYVEGLKPQMDYRTGLVGATFPTSKASIANRIGGRDAAEMLSADQVKRKLGELQKAGLIAPKSTTNSLILLLPKADFDVKNSRPAAAQQPPSKIAQQETQQAAQQEAGEKASEYKVQPPTQETEAAQQTTQQGDPPIYRERPPKPPTIRIPLSVTVVVVKNVKILRARVMNTENGLHRLWGCSVRCSRFPASPDAHRTRFVTSRR